MLIFHIPMQIGGINKDILEKRVINVSKNS
jgi:hypothetical protein